MAKVRKDLRGRSLRKGEVQRSSDKRYMYTYTDPMGRRKFIYANDLTELREKEAKLMKDQLDGLDLYVAGKASVNDTFDRYMSTKYNLRESTRSSYFYTHYLNPDFSGLPEQIKQELQIACVLFTAEVGGVLTLEFDEEGKLNFVTHVEDNDFFYDEIGSELMIKKLRQEKQDFWESLELYYKIFLLGEDEV